MNKSSLSGFLAAILLAACSQQPASSVPAHSRHSAKPATPACTITSVHDGDSMRVRCPGQKKTTPIRLNQIDAPELKQAHGIHSRDYLRSICPVGQKVEIKSDGQDRYGRTLATVMCNGVDANAAMVKAGQAWVYDDYVKDKALYRLQRDARADRAGLWRQRDALPPWEFRRAN